MEIIKNSLSHSVPMPVYESILDTLSAQLYVQEYW